MSREANPATADTPQVLLEHHLKQLRLPTFLREYDKVSRQCAAERVDYPRYLLRLTEQELLDRERRATERRIQQARFPVVKSLDTFEFLAIPAVNKALVLELARCQFLLPARERVVAGQQWYREDASRAGPRPIGLPTRPSCAFHDSGGHGARAAGSPG
jgi:IstB-like ATP binding protein